MHHPIEEGYRIGHSGEGNVNIYFTRECHVTIENHGHVYFTCLSCDKLEIVSRAYHGSLSG